MQLRDNKRSSSPVNEVARTRVKRVLRHYEGQTQEQAATRDEAALRQRGRTVMVVPCKLVPAITKLTERRASKLRKSEAPGVNSGRRATRLRRSGRRAARVDLVVALRHEQSFRRVGAESGPSHGNG
jgi:hypothetical protein